MLTRFSNKPEFRTSYNTKNKKELDKIQVQISDCIEAETITDLDDNTIIKGLVDPAFFYLAVD